MKWSEALALGLRIDADRGFQASPAERAALRELATAALARGDRDRWAELTWMLSLLLERAEGPDAAIPLLEALRTDRDAARHGAGTVGGRAGVTGRYPGLAGRLAFLRQAAGCDARAVLADIEWAKGRALADAAGEAPALDGLAGALAAAGAQYLALLMEPERSLAVLLAPSGYGEARSFPLGTRHLAPLVERIAPALRRRAGQRLLRPAAVPIPWTETLAPLLGWVPPVPEGGTLLLAPHGAAQAFPLHELPLADGRPAARHAVARVHGAAAVLRAVRRPPRRPRRAVALRACTARELGDAAHRASFAQVVAALRRHLPVTVLEGVEADLPGLRAALAEGSLVHLMAHGHAFRARGAGGVRRPLSHRSGVLLAAGGVLPLRGDAAADAPGFLTAAGLAVAGLPLAGCHVTLQACVSGHAEANPQGDNVGMEWAFLLAGAESVLATHWHLEHDGAAAFSAAFYAAWLGDPACGRAEAWRRAAAACAGSPEWSAFSVAGEWR